MFCAILTLFPEACKAYLGASILGIAQEKGLLRVELVNFRDYTTDRHQKADDRPFGGGPGMVLTPQPIFDAVEDAERKFGTLHKILLCPRGATFTQRKARELAGVDRLLLFCGRYEGFDERIRLGFEWDEVSIGDYVLAGGELPALVVLEAAARLLPGVLGCADSPVQESFEADLLDYPHYTRPRSYRGLEVPEVLVSGDHQAVAAWRREQAERLTRDRRKPNRHNDSPGTGAQVPEPGA